MALHLSLSWLWSACGLSWVEQFYILINLGFMLCVVCLHIEEMYNVLALINHVSNNGTAATSFKCNEFTQSYNVGIVLSFSFDDMVYLLFFLGYCQFRSRHYFLFAWSFNLIKLAMTSSIPSTNFNMVIHYFSFSAHKVSDKYLNSFLRVEIFFTFISRSWTDSTTFVVRVSFLAPSSSKNTALYFLLRGQQLRTYGQ